MADKPSEAAMEAARTLFPNLEAGGTYVYERARIIDSALEAEREQHQRVREAGMQMRTNADYVRRALDHHAPSIPKMKQKLDEAFQAFDAAFGDAP